ncbi:MAG: transporter substrate-binding domain-containing protein [Candidatus Gastranaerophilaceae bacterium]
MEKKLLSIVTLFSVIFIIFVTGCTKKDNNADTLDKIMQRGKVIVGVKYDTKPFGYIDEKHRLAGYDIDLARYIAKSLLGDENKIEFRQVTPSNRIWAVNSGQVDMVIATMTVTKQRREIIDFSIPYYVTGQSILVPKNSKITSMTDLNGKRVVIIFGSTAEKTVRLIAPDAAIIGFKTYTSGFEALKHGHADAMTSDDTILMGFAIDDNSVKLLPGIYSKEPYAVAFKKGASSARLKGRVDNIIEDMEARGKLRRLKNKWIKY